MTDEMILSTSDEAASYKTVSGWVSRDGHFYGDNERIARYAGCTHRPCEDCGEPANKHYIVCSSCRQKHQRGRYEALPVEEWDGEPLCLYDGDEFFFDLDDIINFCEEHDLKPADLMLTDTRPEGLRRVDEDYWYDDLPEGVEVPDEVYDALEVLNKAITDVGDIVWWMSGKKWIVLPEATLDDFPTDDGKQE